MPKHYLFLLAAIVTETAGTAALQASEQFTRLWPSLIVIVTYAASFYFMSFALRHMQLGIVYAIWSGLGIVAIAAIGFVVFGQKIDLAGLIGMTLILVGVIVIHLYSETATH